MADARTVVVIVRATLLGDSVLVEIAPDSPRGVSLILPIEDLAGEDWKAAPDA